MSKIPFTCIGLFLASVIMIPAFAQPPQPDDVVVFKKLEPITVKPDQGYIYLRLLAGHDVSVAMPILVRRLTESQMTAYDKAKRTAFEETQQYVKKYRPGAVLIKRIAETNNLPHNWEIPTEPEYASFTFDNKDYENVYFFKRKSAYEKDIYGKGKRSKSLLVQLSPGRYVVASSSLGLSSASCFCMGTVEFEVQAGLITDMGYMVMDLADGMKSQTPFPDIDAVVKGHGTYKSPVTFMATAIRPYTDDMSIPETLENLPRTPAKYQAVGKMPNYFSMMVTRLAPMPGVLDYNEDNVIDVRTGKALP